MLNLLVIVSLLVGIVVAAISIKIEKIRFLALFIACCCGILCFCHYIFMVNPDKEYLRIYTDADIKTKIEYFKNTKLNDDLRKNIIYSVADQVENLSVSNFKTAFINNEDSEMVELLFDRLRENGLHFSEEQLDCFVEAAIANKNAHFRKRLFPSIFATEAVFKYVRNCMHDLDNVTQCRNLEKCLDAFPEIFSENDRKLGKTIADTRKSINSADGSDSNFNEKLAEYAAKKEECATKLLAVTINWTLRGVVERKLDDLENAYLLKSANIEGKSLDRCIVVPTETALEINAQVTLNVKDEGEQYYKLEDGFATLRYFKEDYSSDSRSSLQEQINKCDEETAKIYATLEANKEQLEVYKALFNASLDSFNKNFAQKVKKYEY